MPKKNDDKKKDEKKQRFVIETGELEGGRQYVMVNGQPLSDRDVLYFLYSPGQSAKALPEGMHRRATELLTVGDSVLVGSALAAQLAQGDPVMINAFLAEITALAEDAKLRAALGGGR